MPQDERQQECAADDDRQSCQIDRTLTDVGTDVVARLSDRFDLQRAGAQRLHQGVYFALGKRLGRDLRGPQDFPVEGRGRVDNAIQDDRAALILALLPDQFA